MKRLIILFCLLSSTPLILVQSPPVFAQLNTTLVTLPAPCRIIDTRRSVAGRLVRDQPRNFTVAGPNTDYSAQGGTPDGCGIPGRVRAVVLNLVAVNPVAPGNMQIWPSGTQRPTNPPASAINFSPQNAAPAIANGLVIPVNPNNPRGPNITVLATRFVDLVADVYGYFPIFSNVINVNELRSSNTDVTIRANEDVNVMIDNLGGAPGSFQDAWQVFTNGSFTIDNRIARLDETGKLTIRTLEETGGLDIAENYRRAPSSSIMPGHIVSFIDPDTVELANQTNCSKVLGPISTEPGVLLGGADTATLEALGLKEMYQAMQPSIMREVSTAFGNKDDTKTVSPEIPSSSKMKENLQLETMALEVFAADNLVPVTLAGKVPVKVIVPASDPSKVIRAGDLISPGSTRNGVAEKADGTCPTIGVAMEDYSSTTEGDIMVFVSRK